MNIPLPRSGKGTQMQVHIITVSDGDSAALEELNRFLRGHRVLTLHQERSGNLWSFCISYQPGADGTSARREPEVKKIDYKEVLDAATFALFSKLREWRKQVAETEKLPPYAVMTNEQLANVARERVKTAAAFADIEGVGPSKVERYAAAVVQLVTEHESQPGNP